MPADFRRRFAATRSQAIKDRGVPPEARAGGPRISVAVDYGGAGLHRRAAYV